MINTWIGMGRLTRDPEVRHVANGTEVSSFTIAVDRQTKDSDTADFINCTAFKKTANLINTYFSKGKMIAIEGTLQNNDYTDRSGVQHKTYQIIANKVHFCGDKGNTQYVNALESPQQAVQPHAVQTNNLSQQINNGLREAAQPVLNTSSVSEIEQVLMDDDVPF